MHRTPNNAFINNMITRDTLRFKRLYSFIRKGVHIADPFTTYIADGVRIGAGTTIHPLTVIETDVIIGKGCQIGPFARIRKGVTIKDGASIGNFVEVVRSTISKGARIKHLTYVGDAEIGENVNIGAGTIVANYDGRNKYTTRIKRGAFIGSGSILVAPVTIGAQAVTGAGTVVTKNKNVPDRTIVVGVPARILRKNDTHD